MADDDKTATESPIPFSDNIGKTWVDDVPGLKAKRAEIARPFVKETITQLGDQEIRSFEGYHGLLEEMLERGLVDIEPQGDRLLLRSVLPSDASGGGDGAAVWRGVQDARSLLCSQVLALGPGCAKWYSENGYTPEKIPKPGDYVWVLATVCDRLTTKDKTVRLMTVKAEYIASRIVVRK